jgi:primosomal protein N'
MKLSEQEFVDKIVSENDKLNKEIRQLKSDLEKTEAMLHMTAADKKTETLTLLIKAYSHFVHCEDCAECFDSSTCGSYVEWEKRTSKLVEATN